MKVWLNKYSLALHNRPAKFGVNGVFSFHLLCYFFYCYVPIAVLFYLFIGVTVCGSIIILITVLFLLTRA